MDFLFDNIDFSNNNSIFIQPNINQINDWIKQTNCIYTKEICDFLNITKKDYATYIGPLTPAQQYWIITDLQN